MASLRLRWLAVVAAVVVLAVVATTGAFAPLSDWIARARTQFALERLLDHASPSDLPSARFSAIPGARLRSSVRGRTDVPPRIDVDAVQLLAVSSDSTAPDAVAATAVAWAMRGEMSRAARHLEAAVARAPGEARLWSDLAAAYLELNQPLRALVAVDKALRIDSRLPEAMENRALVLDRIGLPSVIDAMHPSERTRWRAAEKTLLAAASAGDSRGVESVAGQSLGIARVSAEGVYLARWADAFGRDSAKADEWLRVSRMIGEVLRPRGESLAADAVAAIDDATMRGDDARLATLVRAHLAYDRGRRAYAGEDYGTTLRELRAAARAFDVAHSPMADVARTYIAGALIRSSRIEEAAALLAGVARAAEQHASHRALLADARYHLALCETYRGRWDLASGATQQAAAFFRQIGDTGNAGESDNLLASIFDLVGQRERSWEVRLRGFEETSEGGAANRLFVAVGAATRAALRAKDYDLALSFLDIEGVLASRVQSSLLVADLLMRRAALQHERRDFADRDESLARARTAIAAIGNAEERERLSIELDATEAVIVRESEPRRAVEWLGRAIAHCETTHRRFLLPNYLLQRGRAFLAANDPERAQQDFSAGIDEVDAQRGSIREVGLRSRMFDTATELLHEALALQVRDGNAEEAFGIAERARARSLLDLLPGEPRPLTSSAEIARRLAPGTLLLEYAVLRDELAIFAIRNSGLRLHRVPISQADLERIGGSASILLSPVADDVTAAERIIFVPDGVLQRVAFGGLRWNGRYLAQSHILTEAPSASRLAVETRPAPREYGSVLIVGNPAADPERNLAALPRVRSEVATLQAIHQQSHVLLGSTATKSRFLDEAPRFDAIHFGGHGISDDQSPTAALLFQDEAGSLTPLVTSEIGQLRLRRKPLVVLSACGTLRGRVDGVDGMPSIARAFLAAGASAVVGTLTDVDDVMAADLLTSFHRRIAAGVVPEEALRDAQQEAIARGGTAADPKNWAQFVLYSVTP